MIYDIITGADNHLLRTETDKITVFDDDLKRLIRDMKETMSTPNKHNQTGVGLAAPQIGVLKQVCIVTLNAYSTTKKPIVTAFINPHILSHSDVLCTLEEGCLSLPHQFAKVKRPRSIVIEYQNENGKTLKKSFTGWDARILQHEIDHLNGILFIDLIGKNDVYTIDE